MAETTQTPAAVAAPAAKVPVEGSWTSGILDIADDVAVALIGCCLPCVLYGQTAERVHGDTMVNHCLKFYLYSCICACGLVAGPTRKAVRNQYKLPEMDFIAGNTQSDCIANTIPYLNCCILCQLAREVNSRNPAGPIKPEAFTWAPVDDASAPAPTPAPATDAPAQAEMAK